ncbi:hypothetical protein jhhlp_004992 [Lomentospora prolificans]|uniref:Apple domain-containing protein n=1 Tax=Lomentospora prolificans TaxID=41688 RepID=A0A2N3N827_9PEZI|nr:hypothetical protein jhhlp_004992 [Lomentospora prolificans]
MSTIASPPSSGTEGRSPVPWSNAESGLEVVPEAAHLPELSPYQDKANVAPYRTPVSENAQVAGGKRTFCGLRRSTLILLILLISVIIVAAVGGGIGGSLAVKDAYRRGLADAAAQSGSSVSGPNSGPNPNSGSNSDSGSSAESGSDSGSDSNSDSDSGSSADPDTSPEGFLALPATIGRVPVDCPNLDSTTHKVTPQSKTYTFKAICGGDSDPNEGDLNILAFLAYRFSDCLRACASFNERGNVPNTTCRGVHFHSDLKFVDDKGGNCWLKKSVGKMLMDTGDSTKNLHVFGQLQ